MLCVGGMLATAAEKRRLAVSSLSKAPYRPNTISKKSYEIRVPRLTRKEHLYLDRAIPCEVGWQPDDFELPAVDVSAYREVYRFCPAYAELLL
jgi:hypothetical protein